MIYSKPEVLSEMIPSMIEFIATSVATYIVINKEYERSEGMGA
jgi:hypothetical protein